MENKSPLVSVVLPVYNSEKELSAALSELDRQSYQARELIIVDDGSTDGTMHRAKELSSGRSDVRVLTTEHRGPAHARNVGAEQARGAIVFFAESDCVYDPSYLEKSVSSLLSDSTAGAVCLTGAPLVTRPTMATRCIEIENKVQHRQLSEGKASPFYAWVYRRDVFDALGGFDDKLFQAEDKDLFSRLKKAGYKVAWVPGINWRHMRDQTTAELARKWFSRGKTRVLYALKQRRTYEMLKTLGPLWLIVVGSLLLLWSPLVGGGLILLVLLAFLVQSLRVTAYAWPEIDRKRDFIGYPAFLIARNLSMALGYSVALVTILSRRLRGKSTAWDHL